MRASKQSQLFVAVRILLCVAGGANAMAEPSCAAKPCVFDDPKATPAITSYPTTLTFKSFWSSASSASDAETPGLTTEIQNMITWEPHEASPTSFPATVVQTVITTHTFVSGSPAATSVTEEPTYSSWIVHKPAATDLPRHGQGICANCTQPASWQPAQKCVDMEQDTACVRQCAQRDGLWYCFDKHAWYFENVMGRVCWWTDQDTNTTQYLMLAEPCVVGDKQLDCEPCRLYG